MVAGFFSVRKTNRGSFENPFMQNRLKFAGSAFSSASIAVHTNHWQCNKEPIIRSSTFLQPYLCGPISKNNMKLDTVIFDMDGLLVDSEPLWGIAANDVFEHYGFRLSPEQHITTTGLRTREFVHWWFQHFNIDRTEEPVAEERILNRVLQLVDNDCKMMPGVENVFNLFHSLRFKIGIASSSPQALIDLVMDKSGIRQYVQGTASAQHLRYGKPHPQVYLDCAETLQSVPSNCISFEDSFYGMIAAKAARMVCVVVPEYRRYKEEQWGAADLKLSSLQNFNSLHLEMLQR